MKPFVPPQAGCRLGFGIDRHLSDSFAIAKLPFSKHFNVVRKFVNTPAHPYRDFLEGRYSMFTGKKEMNDAGRDG